MEMASLQYTATSEAPLNTPPRPSPKRKRTDSVSHISPAFPFINPDEGVATGGSHIFAPGLALRPLPDHLQRSVSPQPELDHDQDHGDPSTPKKKRATAARRGSESPRTIVAARFGELSLGVDPHKQRRVVKRARTDRGAGHSDGAWRDTDRLSRMKASLAAERAAEDPPPTPSRRHLVGVVIPSADHHHNNNARRPKSRPKSPSPAADPASLTWHDDEITGHLALDPDDDGTGINGVGFRPTPAVQEARQIARRRQVEVWRRREAGEERRRRADRRRRGVGGAAVADAGDGAEARAKIVRFA